MVECPVCLAAEGDPCVHAGKGAAKKNRKGVNHYERMVYAQAMADAEDDLIDLEVIDHDDVPGPHWFYPVFRTKRVK